MPAAKVLCAVQGRSINFEVDSGALYTLMPMSLFDKIKKVLTFIDIKLQLYIEHSINILGSKYSSKCVF